MPKIYIPSQNKTYEVENDSVIYDALDDLGMTLPHGCLAGSCGACKIEVVEGSDNLKPASFIESNTLQSIKAEYEEKIGQTFDQNKNLRLSCRAKICGDIVIEPFRF